MNGEIRLVDVEVERGGVPTVAEVTCDIAGGRWLGVIGANGSGKTTLLRGIAGRLPIANGRLLVDDVDRTDDRGWRARHIGFAPEGDALPGALSGTELFDIMTDGRFRPSTAGASHLLYEALEIAAIARRPISTCSAGMRQRIAIFCAFVGGQRIVILDEPFNWLDPLAAYDVRAALRVQVDTGLTLVTALHDLSTLASSCDAGMLMRDGGVAMIIDAQAMERAASDPRGFERATIEHLRAQPSRLSKTANGNGQTPVR